MNKQEAIHFLMQYSRQPDGIVSDQLADDEVIFRQYIRNLPEAELDMLMDEYAHIILQLEWPEGTDNELFDRIEHAIKERSSREDFSSLKNTSNRLNSAESNPKSSGKVVPILYKLSAAAVALLLLGSAFYFLLRPTKETKTVLIEDVAPGSNKAILTLADGSNITLNSTGNQEISSGKINIIQKNGQLLYDEKIRTDDVAIQYNTLTTPKGGQFRITLPDGTKAWLNSASSLLYPVVFSGKEREVTLTGQGYFEVAKDVKHPFKVKVNNMEVQVLGTSFDIMAYKDENIINTTLVNGALRLVIEGHQTLLKPGNQAILKKGQQMSISKADVNKVTAWKSGFFEFQNMELPAIMRQIERWYDVEAIYEVKNQSFSFGGRISKDQPLSNILRLLEGDGITFKVEGKKVYIRPMPFDHNN